MRFRLIFSSFFLNLVFHFSGTHGHNLDLELFPCKIAKQQQLPFLEGLHLALYIHDLKSLNQF